MVSPISSAYFSKSYRKLLREIRSLTFSSGPTQFRAPNKSVSPVPGSGEVLGTAVSAPR